jgi:hypothetical protein
MSPDDLFTRDEVLGGLPARRAATLLFLIESRTAYLVDQSRRVTDFFLSEEASKERDLVFLEAFNLGREPPVRPTIRQIERHAAQWAPLVPDNPAVRAGVAHLLGQKYKFTRSAVPGIRAALALEKEAVRQAYRRLYKEELEAIFAAQISLAGRLPWAWTALSKWLESLPPFWMAFALTVAFSLSQAFLALPTGVARVGPFPGALLVIVIGLVNILTMACMAEACARSGEFRYGKAFVGRLVTDYLGAEESLLYSVVSAIRCFMVLVAGSIGIGLTFASSTGISAEVWVILLFLVELYYLSRKSLKVTVGTMLSLLALNLILLLPVGLLAFLHVRTTNLFHAELPFLGGKPFELSFLKLAFGVVIMLYVGHLNVVQCAKIVLPKDPSGRSLIRGSVAGTIFLAVLFAAWVFAVNGAIAPENLAGEPGTALIPLAKQVGPSIHLVGTLLVIAILGMSCLRTSTVLFNLAQERIPTHLRAIITLPRRRGSLFLQSRGTPNASPRLGLTYLGLADGQAHFCADVQWDGNLHRIEMTVAKNWDGSALFEHLPKLPRQGVSFALDVLEANPERVRFEIATTMSASYGGEWNAAGLQIADVATLSDSLRRLVNWLMRRGEATLTEVQAYVGGDNQMAGMMIEELIQSGFLQRLEAEGNPRYRIHLAARQGRRVSQQIWHALDSTATAPPSFVRPVGRTGPAKVSLWARRLMLGEPVRFFLSASPLLLVFLIAEGLFLAGTASFAGVLGFGGVIANSLTGGIFPVLLLVSSRRKGDFVPGVVYRFLDHPLCSITLYLLFLANLFLHGLFIWQNPWARGTALFFALLVIGTTLLIFRRGAFSRRTVLELRADSGAGEGAVFRLVTGGKPLSADIQLGFSDGEENYHAASGEIAGLSRLRHATFHLPSTSARELKVWAHKVTSDGGSEGLSALVEIPSGVGTKQFDLRLSGGQVILPLTGGEAWVRVVFPEREDAGAALQARAH